MSKRAASSIPDRKRSRKGTYTIVGYDRQKGGMQAGARGKLIAAMKRAAGGEKKGVDTYLTLNPVLATTNTNGSCFVLNLIQQGAGSWNRIGRKVNLLSARIRFSVTHTYGATAVTNTVGGNQLRMVVVWDKQPSGGAIPTFDTVFGTTDQTGAEVGTILDPIRYDNMDRFAILRDCIVNPTVEATPATGGSANLVFNYLQVDEYIKLGGREVVFSGQSAPMTIADISTGALYVYFRAQVNSLTNQMSITDDAFCRLRYTDA